HTSLHSFPTRRSSDLKLKVFEHPGGVAMSPYETGVQWDLPYGWAPVHLLAVEGMRRYGFKDDADRVAREWVETVTKNFRQDKTIDRKSTRLNSSHLGI